MYFETAITKKNKINRTCYTITSLMGSSIPYGKFLFFFFFTTDFTPCPNFCLIKVLLDKDSDKLQNAQILDSRREGKRENTLQNGSFASWS